jgi:hypothetical protein
MWRYDYERKVRHEFRFVQLDERVCFLDGQNIFIDNIAGRRSFGDCGEVGGCD